MRKLEQAKVIPLPKYKDCPNCKGEGAIEKEKWEECVGDDAITVMCPVCEGRKQLTTKELIDYLEEY